MRSPSTPTCSGRTPLAELPALVADLGYEYIELSPREDFIPFFRHPRVDMATVRAFRKALDAAGVQVSSVLPLFRWSGPDEDERQAAVRYWKRSIEIAVELGVDGHELRVQRPARGSRGLRGPVLAVDGGAAAALRARGHPAARSSRTPTTSSRTAARRST